MTFVREILAGFLLALWFSLSTGGCAPARYKTLPPSSRPAGVVSTPRPALSSVEGPDRVQVGVASWYGPGFHGRFTANGEVYNQHELTAAHPTLPLGARAMVTSLETGQSVEVRINDRGPFVDGRVIDLSYAAGRSIGLIGPGTARVRVEVIGSPPIGSLATMYAVQVGSFVDPERAASLRSRLRDRYSDVYVSPLQASLLRYYQVRLGPFSIRAEAERRAVEVARSGLRAIIVEETDQSE